MPMIFIEGGQQRLLFVSAFEFKESRDRCGKLIRLGDILAALNQATKKINQLQAENDEA